MWEVTRVLPSSLLIWQTSEWVKGKIDPPFLDFAVELDLKAELQNLLELISAVSGSRYVPVCLRPVFGNILRSNCGGLGVAQCE